MRRHLRVPRRHPSTVSALALLPLVATSVVATWLPGAQGVGSSDVSQPTATSVEPTGLTHASTVRLVTGDAVHVLTRADGSTVSTILAGSPHAGGALARWQTPTGSYVLPRMSSSERRRLDLSLFDVTALARYGGRVPVVVRFAPHAAVHRLPGLRLTPTTAHSSPSSVVRGYYGQAFGGLTAGDLSGISSIRLAGRHTAPSRAAVTHHVVVRVVDPRGQAAPGVVVTLMNVDDGSELQDSTGARGRAAFDVPDGHYSALGFTFDRVVIAPELDVTADQTVGLDLGDATVKPHVTMPGYRVLDAVLSIDRAPVDGFLFPFSFSGPHFSTRVQPTGPVVPHGALATGVSVTMAPRGAGHTAYDRVAVTADVSRGVPDDLTYDHHRRDFAKVVDRMFANGPGGLRETFFAAFGDLPNGFVDLFSANQYPVHVPGRRVVLFQAGRHVSYQQTLLPQAATIESTDVTQLGTVRRYVHAGTSHVSTFAHGPVGPGVRGRVDPSADYVTRDRGRLVGSLPLFEGAGSSMFSYVDGRDGSWSLLSRGRELAHGRHQISLHAKVPAGARTYVLSATSQPVSPVWTLSTRVQDVWTFRSGGDHPSVPLLTPRYVPPVSLSGGLVPGRTSFRLGFHSLTRHDHRITAAQLQLSTDDGRSWHDARLTRTSPSTFRVAYHNPGAHGSARFMSMRVLAEDGRGDSVTETAMRVYRLR